ncbi:MAG: 3-oxoacyl-ACP reductase FabG [Chloroflexi bacterium]|jgi:NAD(P)-dependent dehydrogenase (short-subunit alcohol dehydrogenase family)|nr:3-oxoacyl-ACP reductase FabG [Chloroflexota bacterium]
MRLKGKVALVTGGWRGNGRGIAEGFAREGACLALADINGEGVRQTAQELAACYGVETDAVQVDVGEPAAVEAMVRQVVERFGRIDILVNNAGIMPTSPFLDLTHDLWHQVLRVNLDGAFFCSLAVAKIMAQQGGGTIINITSMAGFQAPPNNAAYATSKGGLHMLTRAMAVDLAPYGIRVNAIAPGIILTDLNRHIFEADPARLERNLVRVPMGRIGYPNDLAGAAIFLACDDSAYVTGISLPVDGGYLAR